MKAWCNWVSTTGCVLLGLVLVSSLVLQQRSGNGREPSPDWNSDRVGVEALLESIQFLSFPTWYYWAALRVADHLDRGRVKECAAMALVLDIPAKRACRLLDAAVAEGLAWRSERGQYGATPKGRVVATELREWVVSLGLLDYYSVAERDEPLDGVLASREDVFALRPDGTRGRSRTVWDTIAADPMLRQLFDNSMSEFTKVQARYLVAGYSHWGKCPTLCDFGGGSGEFMRAVTAAHPGVAHPVVVDAAVPAEDPRNSVRFVRFDLLSPGELGLACDCVVMKGVLSDWPDEEAVTLLRRAREAVCQRPHHHPRIIIADHFLRTREKADGPYEQFKHRMDVLLSRITGGEQRTVPQLEALLAEAGVVPTSAPVITTTISTQDVCIVNVQC